MSETSDSVTETGRLSGKYHALPCAAFVRSRLLPMLAARLEAKDECRDPRVNAERLALLAKGLYPVGNYCADLRSPLDSLDESQIENIVCAGYISKIRIHKFKRTSLARVNKVLGILKGLAPSSLLEIGVGRGTFLWPLLSAFPDLPVTAIDVSRQRVLDVNLVRDGGVPNLSALQMDAVDLKFPDGAFDVVTALEVFEHIKDYLSAYKEAVRVARRFVVISVPSKPDNNPEHINLFTQDDVLRLCQEAGAMGVKDYNVLGHRICLVKVRGTD